MASPTGPMIDLVSELAQRALRGPLASAGPHTHWAAMILACTAGNRSLVPAKEWRHQEYAPQFQVLLRTSPSCLRQLKSTDYEALVLEMLTAKRTRDPQDKRALTDCQLTADGILNLHWVYEDDWRLRKTDEFMSGKPVARKVGFAW